VPERFALLTDEHSPKALVKALRAHGWQVVRVEDEPGLGKGASDDFVFRYAAAKGWVWLSRDERATQIPKRWLNEGRSFRGMICWPQRHDRRMTLGDVVRAIEALAAEDDPFATGLRFIGTHS
jgi:PIN like domain